MVGGQSSSIPLKINTAGGVIPIIFASSLMQFPIIICSFFGYQECGIWGEILKRIEYRQLVQSGSAQIFHRIALICGVGDLFCLFYTSITFNPLEIANNMKKSREVLFRESGPASRPVNI